MLRQLYQHLKRWAASPRAVPLLALLSFFESVFFPIPPDPMLLLMSLAQRHRAFYFALLVTLSSVCGGVAGYLLGWLFADAAHALIGHLGLMDSFAVLQKNYTQYQWQVVFVAGFSPLPYKLFTLSSGLFQINLLCFVLASLLSRGLRFFMLATLVYYFGAVIEKNVLRYINYLGWMVVIGVVLLYVNY